MKFLLSSLLFVVIIIVITCDFVLCIRNIDIENNIEVNNTINNATNNVINKNKKNTEEYTITKMPNTNTKTNNPLKELTFNHTHNIKTQSEITKGDIIAMIAYYALSLILIIICMMFINSKI